MAPAIYLKAARMKLFCAMVLFSSFAFPSTCYSEDVQYNRDVRPILAEKCFACHGFDQTKREAGLRLDSQEGSQAVLESGTVAIKPGEPDQSELIHRITSADHALVMPPAELGKELPQQQVEILKKWIAQGAHYEKHWSFTSPTKTEPPQIAGDQDPSPVTNPIDRFIMARLVTAGLTASPEADRITLLRRVSLDLTGLPPSLSEIDEFVVASDQDPDRAYQNLIDRLLQSPAYGERWGRWWLDQARYADSNGYSVDAPRQIWKYRDWVIGALNNDMPFDQFTVEQLAGDLLPDATISQQIATGFHRNTQINQEGGIDPEQFRIDSVFDRVATTGSVWLGLTIGCAQCHNHKFDPITQKEYYQFFAFFNNQEEPGLTVYEDGIDAPALQQQRKQLVARIDELVKVSNDALTTWEASLAKEQVDALPSDLKKILHLQVGKRNDAQRRSLYAEGLGKNDSSFQELRAQLQQVDKQLEKNTTTLVLKELAAPRKTTVFVQGDFTRPADEVSCGTPSALNAMDDPGEKTDRLDLAKWIVSRGNPLTARVIVNRVWQQYFGRGIVETENDFGLQGSAPSHPELLDWLAVEFMDRGWSLKELHRLIITSHVYRQSSNDRLDIREKDRTNELLARQRRLRLDAEIVRDVSLASCGLLSSKIGGPPVFPPIPQGVMGLGQSNRAWNVSEGEDRYRRGLYTFVYRATPPPSLNVFDAPDGYSTCTRRVRSNTPLQALALMNDAAFFEFAQAMDKLIQKEGLETAFRRCTSRTPSENELAVLQQLDTLSAARVLLNLDETVTRE